MSFIYDLINCCSKETMMKYLIGWVIVLGVASAGIGISALSGWLSGQTELYTWKQQYGMALPSAIGVFLLGVGLFLVGIVLKNNEKGYR